MLRLLTDEHLSPAVAAALRLALPGLDVVALADWRHGHLLGARDEVVLYEAHRDGRTLVTHDLRTIPPLLREWAELGLPHAGLVLVDERTIAQADVGGLVAALAQLWRAQGQLDWTNRVVLLSGGRV